MPDYGSHSQTPGYIESVGSTKRKTKEDIRLEQLIPQDILDESGGIKNLLQAYYQFNNMEEFIYQETEVFSDTILNGKAVFRISDPENSNDHFFADDGFGNSTFEITNADGTITPFTLAASNAAISNGNDLPGSLQVFDPGVTTTPNIGKTFSVTGRIVINGIEEDDPTLMAAHNGKSAKLTTIIKYWVGPGPSYILNAIEEALNIDDNTTDYLELMQKEIAASIPRDLTVNKRSLYKSITDFYKVRGTEDSIAIFFRLLFNANVEVEKPWDKTLKPSDGGWDTNTNSYFDAKGQLSNTIKIQDSEFYQKFSYLIRTGKNLSDWKNAFAKLVHPAGFKFFGEILLLTQLTRAVLGDTDKVDKRIPGSGPTQASNALSDGSTGGFGIGNTQYAYKDIYGRLNRKTLSSVPTLQPGVIGIEDLPLLVQMFVSMFTANVEARLFKSAKLSVSLNSGALSVVTIVDKGYGYPSTSAATPTIVGDNGSGGAITVTIDSEGQIDTAVVSAAGSGYTSASVVVPAVPNLSKVQGVYLSNFGDKKYTTAPTLIFDAPTSKDVDQVLLATNVTATAKLNLEPTSLRSIKVTNGGTGYGTAPTITVSGNATAESTIEGGRLESIRIINAGSGYTQPPTITISGNLSGATAIAELEPAEIASVTLLNRGNGYVFTPNIKVGSPVSSENRAKQIEPILIIYLNHLADISRTINGNNYFNQKRDYDTLTKFRDNVPIVHYASNIIQNGLGTSINRYSSLSNIEHT